MRFSWTHKFTHYRRCIHTEIYVEPIYFTWSILDSWGRACIRLHEEIVDNCDEDTACGWLQFHFGDMKANAILYFPSGEDFHAV